MPKKYRLVGVDKSRLGDHNNGCIIYSIEIREKPEERPKEILVWLKFPFLLTRFLAPHLTDHDDIQKVVWAKIRPWLEKKIAEGMKGDSIEFTEELSPEELLKVDPEVVEQNPNVWISLDNVKGKEIVFISCGQVSKEEIELGHAIEKLIRAHTSFEPYFAQSQGTLQGVIENILGKLHHAVGFISILHKRGRVKTRSKEFDRASVWIEQEIAVAAYIQNILKKPLYVASFIEEGILREGLRDKILLNPYPFQAESEILEKLQEILPHWRPQSAAPQGLHVEAEIQYESKAVREDRHDYELVIYLENKGTKKVSDFKVEVMIPRKIISDRTVFACEVPAESTKTHRKFRMTNRERSDVELYRGQKEKIMTIPYFIDDEVYEDHPEVLDRLVTATVFSEDMEPRVTEKMLKDLQQF